MNYFTKEFKIDPIKNKMPKLISIYGIRRSGNHIIANWIMSHYNSGCYINDIGYNFRQKTNNLPCHKHLCKPFDIYENPEIIVLGIENKTNLKIHDLYLNKINAYYNTMADNIKICLIRNCANLIASHLQAWGNMEYHENIPNHWKQYIDLLKNNCDLQLVVYDHWLNNQYKNIIANKIGFTNKNLGIQDIPNYGGGSSFNDSIVCNDKLKRRWQTMTNNKRFISIMENFSYWSDHVDIFGKDEIYNYFNTNNGEQ